MSKGDKTVMEAIKLQNDGHHYQASVKFREAGNQYRDPSEKKELWKAAERSLRIAESD